MSGKLSHLTDIKSTTAKIAKILKKPSTKKLLKNPVVPTSDRERQAYNNMLRALTDTTKLEKQIAKKVAKIKKESKKKIDDLERRRKDLSPLQKKIDDFERRLKNLKQSPKRTKRQSPKQTKRQAYKKLSSRDLRKAKENQALAEEYPDIFMGGRFRKTKY